jgi:hypothetical protein
MPRGFSRRSLHAVLIASACALGGCAVPIEVDAKGGGKYELTIESDFSTRVRGTETLLAKKAEELCPDGYDRLKRRSIHSRHGGITESINWEIQCS